MNSIGIVGAGRLGLPFAVRAAQCGYTVFLHDENPDRNNPDWLPKGHEIGLGGVDLTTDIEQVRDRLRYEGLDSLLYHSDMVFVCVQTPHAPEYDGTNILHTDRPDTFPDFDYEYLKAVCWEIFGRHYQGTVVIVSTVLPGTIERDILPMWQRYQEPGKVVYSPQFIAMGTAHKDFCLPDIVISSGTDNVAAGRVLDFWRGLATDKRCAWYHLLTIPEAEATKILYNTFISTKIAFVNMAQQLCAAHNLRGQEVLSALSYSKRVTGAAYMAPGMGDGGGCHPRDNIALAGRVAAFEDMYNLPLVAMDARQEYARWIAQRMIEAGSTHNLNLCILGARYKVDSPLTDGSHALLIADVITAYAEQAGQSSTTKIYDPYAAKPYPYDEVLDRPHVYLLAVPDHRLCPEQWPEGSIILDPWGYLPEHTGRGVTVNKLGA